MSSEEKTKAQDVINIEFPGPNPAELWEVREKEIVAKLREAADLATKYEMESTAEYLRHLILEFERPLDIGLKELVGVGESKQDVGYSPKRLETKETVQSGET